MEQKKIETIAVRNFQLALSIVAIGMTLYQMIVGFPPIGPPAAEIHYPIHVAFIIAIIFGKNAIEGLIQHNYLKLFWNISCLLIGILSLGFLILNAEYIANRFNFATPLTNLELLMGIGLLIVVMEAARRTIGLVIVLVTLAFLLYAYLGPLLPGPFWNTGFSINRIIELIYLTPEGIWNAPIRVCANFIFLYVLFGALLFSSGAGTFFSDFAQAVAGRAVGGTAKTAVIASSLMGMLSGSAVGNVVTTGSFTIPAMKKAGYRSEFAAGVEAVASSGGSIMPPIMGTAAFLMIDFVGVSYVKIIGYATIPAILYYLALFIMVDLEARRSGMRAASSEAYKFSNVTPLIKEKGYLFIPVFLIIYFLIAGYTPSAGAFWATLSIAVLVAVFDRKKRKQLHKVLIEAMVEAPKLLTSVAIACVMGGIIAGVINMTGMGIRISGIVLDISGGITIIALFLTMVVGIILGMGMPVPGVYIILATLLAPGLVRLGFVVEAVHLFIIYVAVMSNITPPVAVASFAAAAIADTSIWRASWEAIKLGLATFIIPFMFIYGPSLLGFGSIFTMATSTLTALVGIFTLSIASIGWFRIRLSVLERIITLFAALNLLRPGYITDVIGIGLLVLIIIRIEIRKRRQTTGEVNP